MKIPDRIEINNKKCAGKPCIKGTRLTVDFILDLLTSKWTYEQIQEQYNITLEDILAVLDYAKQLVNEEQLYHLEV